MKRNEILKVNTKIEITSQKDNTVYKSIIQEIGKEDFLIALPVYKRIPLHLYKNDVVYIYIYTDDACYIFYTEVLGVKKEDDLIFYVLKNPNDIQKTERRDFVRVKKTFLIEYEEFDRKKHDNFKNVLPKKKAYTVDISGGGIQIVLYGSILIDTLLVLNIPLDVDDEEIVVKALGQVVRIEKSYINNRYCNKIGIEFVDILERDRDLIIKYIFKLMRKSLHLRRGDF